MDMQKMKNPILKLYCKLQTGVLILRRKEKRFFLMRINIQAAYYYTRKTWKLCGKLTKQVSGRTLKFLLL